MYTLEQYAEGEAYRTEWYKSRDLTMDLSWNSLPVSVRDNWVKESQGSTEYEEIA
jgi:hypothetical protein